MRGISRVVAATLRFTIPSSSVFYSVPPLYKREGRSDSILDSSEMAFVRKLHRMFAGNMEAEVLLRESISSRSIPEVCAFGPFIYD